MRQLSFDIRLLTYKYLMLKNIEAEWTYIYKAVDRIMAEIDSTASPIPTPYMSRLLIASEDRRFTGHPGADPVALCRAFWRCMHGDLNGGSTIAMQLVRTITGRYERTVGRKIREIILAILLTKHRGRKRLPQSYLWIAYYGWRMNNFKQACARLGLDSSEITEVEEAKLIARLKYPQPQNPREHRIKQIKYRAYYMISLEANEK